MKTFSPFRKGYRSSWWSYPSLAQLTKRTDGYNNFKEVRELCGCDTCERKRKERLAWHGAEVIQIAF